jgi:branched-chain amino acid transport system permease protein
MSVTTPTESMLAVWRSRLIGGRRPLIKQVILFAAVIVLVGFGVPDQFGSDLLAVLTVAACYALLAIGTNMLLGWSGMMTFCQAAFFGIGAYSTAIFKNYNFQTEVSMLIAVGIAGITAYVLYFLISSYTHIAFAMLTLVLGQFVFLFASGDSHLGNTTGLYGVLRAPVLGFQTESSKQFWWLSFLTLAVAACGYWWLNRRVIALRMFAGREDRGRLETLGYNVRQLHAIAGAISAIFCATGGVLYAEYTSAVSPTVFQFELSGAAVFMCVIGGTRFLWGPIVGAVLYTLLVNYWLQSSLYASLYTGIIFVVVMLAIPGGVLSTPATSKNLYWSLRRRWSHAFEKSVPAESAPE